MATRRLEDKNRLDFLALRMSAFGPYVQCSSACPLSANSGHWLNNLLKQKDHLAAVSPKSDRAKLGARQAPLA